ncbi:MAG: hypothetical protein ACFFCS_17360 [Candidatus Hodarchaeota archaeon]
MSSRYYSKKGGTRAKFYILVLSIIGVGTYGFALYGVPERNAYDLKEHLEEGLSLVENDNGYKYQKEVYKNPGVNFAGKDSRLLEGSEYILETDQCALLIDSNYFRYEITSIIIINSSYNLQVSDTDYEGYDYGVLEIYYDAPYIRVKYYDTRESTLIPPELLNYLGIFIWISGSVAVIALIYKVSQKVDDKVYRRKKLQESLKNRKKVLKFNECYMRLENHETRHLLGMNGWQVFPCIYCKETFNSRDELATHYVKKRCLKLPDSLDYSALPSFLREEIDQTIIKKSFDERALNLKELIKPHEMHHIKMLQNGESTRIACIYCKTKFDTIDTLIWHYADRKCYSFLKKLKKKGVVSDLIEKFGEEPIRIEFYRR